MKQFKLILAAVLISALTAAIAAERASSPPPFEIAVELSGGQAKMRCREGCTWVTSMYGCGPADSCTFIVDETGVKGVAP